MMRHRSTFVLAVALLSVSTMAALAAAQTKPASTQPGDIPGQYTDPIPHDVITQPYRICQDLEELTARIDNLYRKPYHKLFDATGAAQPETIFFKDVTSGHEVMTITRELCSDISHPDLGRPVWTFDGKRILFMGNRGYIDQDGRLQVNAWTGHKYIMNADYSGQRAFIVRYPDGKRTAGIEGKFNILDPRNPGHAYYAVSDKLWRVTIGADGQDSTAELIADLATKHRKIIQALSRDGKILIQDLNADIVRATRKPAYMPEIHLVDLNKKPGDAGFYYHHPFDYGLPEVKDDKGQIVHAADNNYQFHSLAFGKLPNTIAWNYGPMTDVGEYLGWTLDITDGLDAKPTHSDVSGGQSKNSFGQYESHGSMVGPSTWGLYFGGPAKLTDGKSIGAWGLWMRNFADGSDPVYFMDASGGHVAGGQSFDPFHFAAHIGAGDAKWRARVKESDAIVYGDVREKKAQVLCYTYSDVRGGIKKERGTGKITWTGMDNNDARPYSSIPRPLLSPDATKVLFHSCMLQPLDQWVGIYVAVLRKPDPPTDLKLADRERLRSLGTEPVELTFKPAALSHETKTWHLYRADADGKDFAEVPATFTREGDIVRCVDTNSARKNRYVYAVTSEEWSGLESDTTSNTVGTAGGAPITGGKFDTTPPPTPANFKVAAEADEKGQYRLSWDKSPAGDLRYYNVYVSRDGQNPQIGQKRLVASPIASMTSYLDWSAPTGGAKLVYAITAVDRQGNESAPAFAAP